MTCPCGRPIADGETECSACTARREYDEQFGDPGDDAKPYVCSECGEPTFSEDTVGGLVVCGFCAPDVARVS